MSYCLSARLQKPAYAGKGKKELLGIILKYINIPVGETLGKLTEALHRRLTAVTAQLIRKHPHMIHVVRAYDTWRRVSPGPL